MFPGWCVMLPATHHSVGENERQEAREGGGQSVEMGCRDVPEPSPVQSAKGLETGWAPSISELESAVLLTALAYTNAALPTEANQRINTAAHIPTGNTLEIGRRFWSRCWIYARW